MRDLTFSPLAFEEFLTWKDVDEDIFDKIVELIKAIQRDPFKGIGKPEPLKGNLKGAWSRRITQKHRIVYRVLHDAIYILKLRGHYDED